MKVAHVRDFVVHEVEGSVHELEVHGVFEVPEDSRAGEHLVLEVSHCGSLSGQFLGGEVFLDEKENIVLSLEVLENFWGLDWSGDLLCLGNGVGFPHYHWVDLSAQNDRKQSDEDEGSHI